MPSSKSAEDMSHARRGGCKPADLKAACQKRAAIYRADKPGCLVEKTGQVMTSSANKPSKQHKGQQKGLTGQLIHEVADTAT